MVATTHLTSDHSDRRPGPPPGRDWPRLAEGLAGVDGDLVLVGDFNDGGDEPAEVLGLRDAWTEVHGPGDRTPTFDPPDQPAGRRLLADRPGVPAGPGADPGETHCG